VSQKSPDLAIHCRLDQSALNVLVNELNVIYREFLSLEPKKLVGLVKYAKMAFLASTSKISHS
jgi:hypothetical protein